MRARIGAVMAAKPAKPAQTRSEAFRAFVTKNFDLGSDEMEVLTDACDTMDAIAALADDMSIPALREARQQRALLLRQLAMLNLPADAGDGLMSPQQIQAKRAADARWKRKHG
jgi:hypothetical protein